MRRTKRRSSDKDSSSRAIGWMIGGGSAVMEPGAGRRRRWEAKVGKQRDIGLEHHWSGGGVSKGLRDKKDKGEYRGVQRIVGGVVGKVNGAKEKKEDEDVRIGGKISER